MLSSGTLDHRAGRGRDGTGWKLAIFRQLRMQLRTPTPSTNTTQNLDSVVFFNGLSYYAIYRARHPRLAGLLSTDNRSYESQ